MDVDDNNDYIVTVNQKYLWQNDSERHQEVFFSFSWQWGNCFWIFFSSSLIIIEWIIYQRLLSDLFPLYFQLGCLVKYIRWYSFIVWGSSQSNNHSNKREGIERDFQNIIERWPSFHHNVIILKISLILFVTKLFTGSLNWTRAMITQTKDISTDRNAIRKWYRYGSTKNALVKKTV